MRPDLLVPKSITPEVIRTILQSISLEVSFEAMAKWTSMEQLIVCDWAIRELFHASGNRIKRRSRPSLVDTALQYKE
jgi:hypothetical protein